MPSTQRLEYSTRGRHRVVRRTAKYAAGVALAVAAGVGIRAVSPVARRWWTVRQCLAYEPAQDEVRADTAVAATTAPACWQGLVNREFPVLKAGLPAAATGGGRLLFLHARVSPGGHRRLVCLAVSATPRGSTFQCCVVHLPDAAVPVAGVVESDLTLAPHHADLPVAVHLARADPADPARFTVEVDYAGRTHAVVGRLADDDTV